MLPKGSSKHCAADKFSLFSKAFLSISNAPLWQVEGKHTKFCGRAVFPALRCQKTSKRSFFTSKKIDRFGYVTQPDQASVPCVYEYKWSGRTNQRWFTSGPQGRNVISKSLRFFFCVCVCVKDSLQRIPEPDGSAWPWIGWEKPRLRCASCRILSRNLFIKCENELNSSHCLLIFTALTYWLVDISGAVRSGYRWQTLIDQLVHRGQGNLEVPMQMHAYYSLLSWLGRGNLALKTRQHNTCQIPCACIGLFE